ACKMLVYQGKTTGARLVINKPSMNNVYDFPLLPQWKTGFNLVLLLRISRNAVAILTLKQNNVKAGLNKPIHAEFVFNGECEIWPRMCREGDAPTGDREDDGETSVNFDETHNQEEATIPAPDHPKRMALRKRKRITRCS
ncbi:MAG: hypothetical protein ACRC6G_06595, partial [Deefgea sp.]